jgi:hypothetical protein
MDRTSIIQLDCSPLPQLQGEQISDEYHSQQLASLHQSTVIIQRNVRSNHTVAITQDS